jgi:NTE family protein
MKKTALILSGGGAKGAFQAAAEKYAREEKGYHWDLIFGVSVGALNGTMLAMEKYDRLWQVWNTISNSQVFTGGLNVWSAIKLLFGKKSFYGNGPLRHLLHQEFDPAQLCVELRIGTVSMVTGEYVQFKNGDPNLEAAVMASTVMPVIWEPEDVSPEFPCMVDGGVRNISPIGDVLEFDPDEIVIINCSSTTAGSLDGSPKDVTKIGLRTLDLLLNELFVSDMNEFMRINHLVKEAGEHGVTLHHPTNGRPLKYYDCKIIEPLAPLDDTLDFEQPAVQRSIRAGIERARQVLG